MKFIKLCLFIFLAFLSLNVNYVFASEVTDSVTIKVTDDTPCKNGANNPPTCSTCPDKQTLVNGKCIEPAQPTGSIMSSFVCTIAVGKNSCTTPLSWTVTNPVAGAKTAVTNNYDSTSITSSPKDVTVHYPNTIFYLYHNEKELSSIKISANCDSLTSTWDSISNTCKATAIPEGMKGAIEASDCVIAVGAKSCKIPFSWKVVNPEVVGGSAVTIPVENQVGKGDNGTGSFSLLPGSTKIYLYNNQKQLDVKEVSAKTDPKVCTINTTTGVCEKPTIPDVDPNTPCANGASNPPTCTTCPDKQTLVAGKCTEPEIVSVDGGWSYWSPARSSVCGGSGTQTRTCTNPAPQGKGKQCVGSSTQTYINNQCPSLDMRAQFNGVDITTGKSVKYNSSVNVIWESNAYTRSCSCLYFDAKSTEKKSCGGGVNSSFKTPALKRNTTFEVSCEGDYGMTISKSLEVLVDDINANYIEQ